VIESQGIQLAFALPVRVEPLVKRLRGDRAQAERVAWRQLLRWTQAQMAMVEVGMVRAEEVYAPYMLQAGGRTLFELLTESRFKALPAPVDKVPAATVEAMRAHVGQIAEAAIAPEGPAHAPDGAGASNASDCPSLPKGDAKP
jgi:hypothetical protein